MSEMFKENQASRVRRCSAHHGGFPSSLGMVTRTLPLSKRKVLSLILKTGKFFLIKDISTKEREAIPFFSPKVWVSLVQGQIYQSLIISGWKG